MSGPGDVADVIELRGLRVVTHCGLLPEERERAQPFEIDLDISGDLAAAGTSDDLADTVDYGAVCDRVAEVAAEPCDLMERLATRIADAVLALAGVASVRVAVRKLRPPVPHDLATAGVVITRHR